MFTCRSRTNQTHSSQLDAKVEKLILYKAGSHHRVNGSTMFTPSTIPPPGNPGSPPDFLPKPRRRGIIACSACRFRKARCITSETPPVSPCVYCTRKGLKCEYIPIAHQEQSSDSANRSSDGRPSEFGSPTSPTQVWAGTPHGSHPPPVGFPNSQPQGQYFTNFGHGQGNVSYPEFSSMQHSNLPQPTPVHPSMHPPYHLPNQPFPQQTHSSSASAGGHPYDVQRAYAAQYLSNRGRPSNDPSQSGSPVANGGYYPNFGQDVPRADYDWISVQSSQSGSPYG
ncbi:hypothetical protein B0H16DRAFT_786504 [Mycena metata]|uniref:Zn(2)-C6 fungal-type domain-containing protein n=1 Tax=Mycena metata TaxID=1033252 RepID=A0AAD7DT62_9AGAR|nr:hypothetical protein B0H16DRAFT_786504 [Mycena metata]